MTDDFLLIFCTCPDRDSADGISRRLVEAGHAACVNQLPGIRSTYRWQGKLCQDEEVLLLIKSRAALLAQVEKCVTALHPYELPEIIAVPVTGGSGDYLEWLENSLSGQAK